MKAASMKRNSEKNRLSMSGECTTCSEHALECTCLNYPEFPDNSIPKDGKTYLACNKKEGMMLVFTPWKDADHYYSHEYDYVFRLEDFSRWMDDKGNWHEVKCGNP